MKKILFGVCLVVTAVGMWGCEEFPGCEVADCTPPCKANRCMGDTMIVCLNGSEIPKDCGMLGCDPMTGMCGPCTERNTCVGDQALVCEAGKILQTEYCGVLGCDPNTGMCRPCTEKNTCVGKHALVCEAGRIVQTRDCPVGCDPMTGTCNTRECTTNTCFGNRLMVCNDGKIVQTVDCPVGCNSMTGTCSCSVCGDNSMLPNPNGDTTIAGASCDPSTYYGACSDDFTKRYYCGNDKTVVEYNCNTGCDPASLGNNGSKCKAGGSDLKEGGNVGDACYRNTYKQTCINGGANALVCWDDKVTQWDCAGGCQDAGYDPAKPLQVNCPKGASSGCTGDMVSTGGTAGESCCDAATYQVSCINSNANALICSNGTVKQWDCANSQCSVADNKVTCPQPGAEICDPATYVPTCESATLGHRCSSSGSVSNWTCEKGICVVRTDGTCTKANSNCVDGRYDTQKFANGFIECAETIRIGWKPEL